MEKDIAVRFSPDDAPFLVAVVFVVFKNPG